MGDPELAAAVARLLQDDQERILSLASSLRAPGRSIESTVSGTSMGAGLPPGSRIRIELAPEPQLETGSVIAFVGGGQVVVHRLVHAGRDYLLTRGDARIAPDQPVKREQVLGPVRAFERDGAWRCLEPPAPRGVLQRCGAAIVLAIARGLLFLGPRLTAMAMHSLHALEGRAQVVHGRLMSGSR